MSGLTEKLRRVYVPMTETGFYILFCLQQERHGYSITQKVKELTEGQLSISPGTMYGTLAKMEKDGLIAFVREEEPLQTMTEKRLILKKCIAKAGN